MLDHGLQLWTNIKLPIYKRNICDRRVTDLIWIGLVIRCHVVFSVKFIVMIVVMLKIRMIFVITIRNFQIYTINCFLYMKNRISKIYLF